MAETQLSKEHKELLSMRGKLNALSAVLKLGHEAFEKPTLQQLANHIVNNSQIVAPYERSALIDMRGNWPKIIAVSGQPEVNVNSEYCLNLANLVQPFTALDKVSVLSGELLKEKNARKGAFEALEYLRGYFDQMLLIPIRQGSHDKTPSGNLLLWVVEFSNDANLASAGSLLPLLAQHYGEALFFTLYDKKKIIHRVIDRKKWLKPSRVALILLCAFVISLFVVPVRQNVAADFEIMPAEENFYYAPFEGVIEKCFHKSGDRIEPTDKILSYNTEERFFDLAAAVNAYNKISAQLDLVQQQSFKEISKRGEVRMLELQKEKAEISIKRNKWFMEKSVIHAKQAGILDIGDKDKLEGKAVRAGEKLFEVLSTEGLIALVYLNEQNASVLGDDCKITLYLHTMPEMPLVGKIDSISPKPVLTEKKNYCYLIRIKLDSQKANLICGMRGVARISGPRVPFGYYLFRNIVLWWRRL